MRAEKRRVRRSAANARGNSPSAEFCGGGIGVLYPLVSVVDEASPFALCPCPSGFAPLPALSWAVVGEATAFALERA